MNNEKMKASLWNLYHLNHQELFEMTKVLVMNRALEVLQANGYPNPKSSEMFDCASSMIDTLIPEAKREALENYRPVAPKPFLVEGK
jgi:hypothetical protein